MAFISSVEAAAILQVGADTLRQWARVGRVPSYRAGRKWIFKEEDIRAYKGFETTSVVKYEPSKRSK